MREARAARFCSAKLSALATAGLDSTAAEGSATVIGSAAGEASTATICSGSEVGADMVCILGCSIAAVFSAEAYGSALAMELSKLAKRVAFGFTPKSSEASIAKLSTETASLSCDCTVCWDSLATVSASAAGAVAIL